MSVGNHELSLNKLIILYMLKSVETPLSNSQLSEFVLDNGYTTYFAFQEYISQMIDNQLISTISTNKTTLYQLTSLGLQALDFFENRIPDSTKVHLTNYLKVNRYKIRSESELTSDYMPQPDGTYMVHCIAKENKKILVDLSIEVIDKEYALKICKLWEKNSLTIYKMLLDNLLKEDET